MLDFIPREVLITLIEWIGVAAVTGMLALAPAVKNRRPVVFVYARRELFISLGLYVVILAGTLLAVLNHIPILETITTGDGEEFTYTFTQFMHLVLFAAAIAAPFVTALLIRRQPWLSVGLSKRNLRSGLEIGISLGLIAIFLTGKIYSLLNGLNSAEGLYLAGALISAFAQELVFRGFIQLRLNTLIGDQWSWIVTALFYTVWNLPRLLIVQTLAPVDLAWQLFLTLGLGLMLGWVMRKSGSLLATTLYNGLHTWLQIL